MNEDRSVLAALADSLVGLANWVDDELAAGQPPKHVAQTAVEALRWIAAELRAGGAR